MSQSIKAAATTTKAADIDLATLTPDQLDALANEAYHQWNPKWQWVLFTFWVLLVIFFTLRPILYPHFQLQHHLPRWLFSFTPGREKYEVEVEVKDKVAKEEAKHEMAERERIRSMYVLPQQPPRVWREGGEEVEMKMMTPRERPREFCVRNGNGMDFEKI